MLPKVQKMKLTLIAFMVSGRPSLLKMCSSRSLIGCLPHYTSHQIHLRSHFYSRCVGSKPLTAYHNNSRYASASRHSNFSSSASRHSNLSSSTSRHSNLSSFVSRHSCRQATCIFLSCRKSASSVLQLITPN